MHSPDTRRGPSRAATARADAIAALYAEHHNQLQRRVTAAAHTDPQTIQDACSYAWARLLSRPAIDVASEPAGILRWLTTTATREASRLHTQRDIPAGPAIQTSAHASVSSAHELAALRARIALVRELPERPRRFLIRLILGYSYTEISTLEGVSATTTNKQIARAKRILRELEQRDHA